MGKKIFVTVILARHLKFMGIMAGFIILPLGNDRLMGQVSHGGTPKSFVIGIKAAVPEYILPATSNDSLLRAEKGLANARNKAFRFAVPLQVNLDPVHAGRWDIPGDGTKIWRLAIVSKGAFSLGLVFTNFRPAPGGKMYVYNRDHSVLMGAYTSENTSPGNVLALMPLPGDYAVIEYDLPELTSENEGFTISTVAHDYKDFYSLAGNSGSCNLDVNCPQAASWKHEKNSVCKLLINSIELCSGVLVNNTKEDGRPFLLTANHCISTDSLANRTLFIFNYEKDSCNSLVIPSSAHTISGSWLRATQMNLDFTLLELGEPPPYSFSPWYAGWNIDSTGMQSGTAIHHPQGDVKKISFDTSAPLISTFEAPYTEDAFWQVTRWATGTTEPGSSGSPLFDQDHYMIGTLTGGEAVCGNAVNDFFSRIGRSWKDYADSTRQLRYWLDPLHTGAGKLEGMNPYPYQTKNCVLLSNFLQNETATSPVMPGGEGYYTGQNSYGWSRYAEMFITGDTLMLTGAYLNISRLLAGTPGSYITLMLWKGASVPEDLLLSQQIDLSGLSAGKKNFILFPRLMRVMDTIFAGFEVNYGKHDSIALFMAPDRILPSLNTAYAWTGNQWEPFPDVPGYSQLSTSMDIELQSCDTLAMLVMQSRYAETLQLYPNPGTGIFNLAVPGAVDPRVQLKVFSLTGQEIPAGVTWNSGSACVLDMSLVQPGIYIILVQANGQHYTAKLVKY